MKRDRQQLFSAMYARLLIVGKTPAMPVVPLRATD
jgi:hypothetical protein